MPRDDARQIESNQTRQPAHTEMPARRAGAPLRDA